MGQVVIEHDDAVAVVRLNRPPVNAIDLDFAAEFESAFAPLEEESDTRAVVVTGTGTCFCAGLDLKRVPRYDREEQRAMIGTVNKMLSTFYACPLPVVGAINGHAIAGGLILALACDYRVGTNAPCELGLTEVRAGIPFPAAAMAVLQAEVRPNVARILALRGDNVGPNEAFELGLLDELQAPENVLPKALEIARDLAGMPHDAYARIKHQLRGQTARFLHETVVLASDPMLDSWVTSDARSAAAKLLGRRRSDR